MRIVPQILISLLALVFVAKADIKNVFSGANLIFSPSSPNSTTIQSQICDGQISPSLPISDAIWGVCTGSTSQNPSIQMTVSSPVGFRTIITTLANDTTTDTNITITALLSNGTTLTASGTRNFFCYSSALLMMSSTTLSLTSSTSKYLCTPEFLVVEQHMLWGINGLIPGVTVG